MQHFHIHEQVHKSSIYQYSTKTAPASTKKIACTLYKSEE